MKIRHLSPRLLALAALLVPAVGQEESVIVRVGTRVYRQSEVQQYFNQSVSAMRSADAEPTESDALALRTSVVSSYVSMGLMENKFNEFGLGALTDEDNALIDERAQQLYDQVRAAYVAQIAQQYGKTEAEADRYADMFMELDGYTLGRARGQALTYFKEEKLLDYVAGSLAPLADDEVEAYYQANLVAPCRQMYAHDIAAFETEVLYGGQPS